MEPVGEKNAYECLLGHRVVTINRDEGTTPYSISCPVCGARSFSQWYAGITVDDEPTYEWYRPRKIRNKSPMEYAHVKAGGLLLRKMVTQ